MVGPVNVVCATTDGAQQTYQIGWDNTQSFFDGKGYIPRLFCEGGYAYQHPVYVSDELTDSSLGYYNGVTPAPIPTPEPTPTASPTPSDTPTPSPTPTPSATPTPEPSSTTTPEPSPSPSATAEPSASPTPSQSTPDTTPTPTTSPAPTESQTPAPSGPTFPANSVHMTGDEWGTITLTAPEGTVFVSVYFANYGMPIDYTVNPDCSADVTSYVAAAFIGKNTGTIEVTNTNVNGDPCYGVSKHMSIILIYGPSSQPPAVDTTTATETSTATAPSEPSTPTPDPQPVPTPTPDPVPTPQPAPQPRPVQDDVVVVHPKPEPLPDPTPVPPAPEPTPSPAETPIPQPDPVPTDSSSDAATVPVEPSTDTSSTDQTQTSDQTPTPSTDTSIPTETTAPSGTDTASNPEQTTSIPETPKPTTPQITSSTPGLVPNNPSSLPETTPLLPPASALVPRVQVDKPGVENGGIQFFGTKSAPQVVGEDGKLTPPAPPPGSGLPIPPDAITTADTFIGQPGGTSFNAPDIAVPVIETPIEGALAAVPGVQALNHAFVAMANIGNDMSPVTRKKAKKILVTTVVVGQIAALRRRFL